jgi:hypothetical protein
MQFLFCDVIFGHIIYGLIKISVAIFYQRIFFLSSRFNVIAYVYVATVIGWVFSATFVSLRIDTEEV